MRLTEFSSSRTQWHKHNKFPAPNGARFHRTNQPETCHTRYDGAGNVQVMVTADGTVTNSYDRANRLTASVSPLGTTTFTYDANNRRTGMQTPNGNITTYTWTDDNQLAAVALANSGGTVTNTYDGDGLRFSRTDSSGTNSYLWNGQVLEAELGSGNTVSTWYTQGMGDGNQGTGEFGDIVSTRNVAGSATSWPQYDASGNVSQTTDSSSSITTTLAYDTFGVVTDNSGPANPTVAWQGKQGYQFESTLGPAGLQYVRQRWYDPTTRQFISPDPLGFAGGDVNLFRYAGNNPVNANDPSGEWYLRGNNAIAQPGDTLSGLAEMLHGHALPADIHNLIEAAGFHGNPNIIKVGQRINISKLIKTSEDILSDYGLRLRILRWNLVNARPLIDGNAQLRAVYQAELREYQQEVGGVLTVAAAEKHQTQLLEDLHLTTATGDVILGVAALGTRVSIAAEKVFYLPARLTRMVSIAGRSGTVELLETGSRLFVVVGIAVTATQGVEATLAGHSREARADFGIAGAGVASILFPPAAIPVGVTVLGYSLARLYYAHQISQSEEAGAALCEHEFKRYLQWLHTHQPAFLAAAKLLGRFSSGPEIHQ